MQKAVALKRNAGNTRGVARSLLALAGLLQRGERGGASSAAEEAVTLFRADEGLDPSELAAAIAFLAVLQGDPEEAQSLLHESDELLVPLPEDDSSAVQARQIVDQAREQLELQNPDEG
jgi:Flp pilus assembly protein TadD